MTRRAFVGALVAHAVWRAAPAEGAGLHVRGMLVDDATDLQPGYFALCGEKGVCHAKDAISIAVHPDNALYMASLREKVGRVVQVSIF